MTRSRGKWVKLFMILFALATLGALAAIVIPLAARRAAQQVTLVAAAGPEEVAANQALWTPGEPVAEIYGLPAATPAYLVFPQPARLVHPKEAPTLTLYLVDKQKGENPLQLKTVQFFARWALLGSGIAMLTFGLAWWRLGRSSQHAAASLSV